MPNAFAFLVLFTWPLVAIFLFRAMPIPRAIAWTIVAGYLLLPERVGFDPPLLPPFDKSLIPAGAATVMALFMLQDPRRPRPPAPGPGGQWLLRVLIGLVLCTPFVTVLTNNEPVIAGPLFIPPLRVYDAFSMINATLAILIPFILGRRFLTTDADHAMLLRVFALAGIAYTLPILIELRLSPQLNVWIYGFFPHSFLQHMRGSGYRPLVFLNHGLWLAIFMAMAVLAAGVLWRLRRGGPDAMTWLGITGGLFVVLLFVKSLGAFMIVLVLLPAVLLFGPKGQLRLAAVVALFVLLFPLLRGADLVPLDRLVTAVGGFAPDRAASLQFRIDNENLLLDRANLKPLTGWGAWGRSRVYDTDTGKDLSVTDGAWIIVIGSDGWLGYIGRFGLLAMPILLLWARVNRLRPSLASSGLALLLAANLVDLLPNATLTPLTWLVAGAIAGRLGAATSDPAAAGSSPAPARPRGQRFARPVAAPPAAGLRTRPASPRLRGSPPSARE